MSAEMVPTRDGYVEGLLEAGERDARIVVLDADVSRSIGSIEFARRFPDRAFNVGVSEQDMMGEAAGLALSGYIPFVSTYGVFVVGRAWDQLRTSVCHMNLPVKVGGAHAGVSVGPDGATHQALEDLAVTRVLPNMTVLAPADAGQTRAAVLCAAEAEGPVYIRFGRDPVPVIYSDSVEVEVGNGDLMVDGEDVLLVGCGIMVSEALRAARILGRNGIGASVLNMVSIKPIDENLLRRQASKTGAVVVAEDHQVAGGLCGAVAEYLAENLPVKAGFVGVRNSFGTSGAPSEVRKRYGLTAEAIAAKAASLLGAD